MVAVAADAALSFADADLAAAGSVRGAGQARDGGYMVDVLLEQPGDNGANGSGHGSRRAQRRQQEPLSAGQAAFIRGILLR